MGGGSSNDVVDKLDLKELARPHEIAGDADIRIGWGSFPTYSGNGISGAMWLST